MRMAPALSIASASDEPMNVPSLAMSTLLLLCSLSFSAEMIANQDLKWLAGVSCLG